MIRKPVKIVFVLVLTIIFSFPGCNNNRNDLPEKLGGLILSKTIKGNDAAKVVHKMHGKRLGATEYLIGLYGNGNSKNILYVSIYENAETAKADLMSMAVKMAKGTPVFGPLKSLGEMGDNVRFRTEGMGLVHYFYRVDNILLWWQVEPGKAESTYDELLKFDFTSLRKGEKGKQGLKN